jgi:hypothetical protein
MKAIIYIYIISCSFVPLAQVPLAEIVTENNPLALTQAEIPNLVFLELLSPADATLLNTYFNSGGQLLNSYQLQGILDREVNEINMLLQHIKIQEPSFLSSHSKPSFHLQFAAQFQLPQLLIKEDQFVLWKDTNHLGNSLASQTSVKLEWRNWRTGMQLAKDVGEPIWHQTPVKGFDFLTGFIAWGAPSNNKVLQKVFLGAYQMQWGQGLLLWSSRGMGKSIDLLQLARNPMGLKPYQGRDEQRFLNGIALQFNKAKHQLTLLNSLKFIDAKPPTDTLQQEFNLQYTNGLHRTPNEISKRKQAFEQVAGAGYTYRTPLWQIGTLVLYQDVQMRKSLFDTTNAEKPFKPLSLWSGSIYAQGTWRQLYCYGELATTDQKEVPFLYRSAVNLAFVYYLDPRLEIGFHLRNYGPLYQTFYANPIGNATKGSNERGFILQLKWQVRPKVLLKISSERSVIPFLMSNHSLPITQHELRCQQHYQMSKKQLFLQQFTIHSTPFNKPTIRLKNELQLQLNANELLQVSAQLGIATTQARTSKQLELNWTHAPLVSNFHFECVYGLYQVPKGTSAIYTNIHLLGIGAQSLQLNGIGSYTMMAVKYSSKQDWKVTIALNFKHAFTVISSQKFQCFVVLTKKI